MELPTYEEVDEFIKFSPVSIDTALDFLIESKSDLGAELSLLIEGLYQSKTGMWSVRMCCAAILVMGYGPQHILDQFTVYKVIQRLHS